MMNFRGSITKELKCPTWTLQRSLKSPDLSEEELDALVDAFRKEVQPQLEEAVVESLKDGDYTLDVVVDIPTADDGVAVIKYYIYKNTQIIQSVYVY